MELNNIELINDDLLEMEIEEVKAEVEEDTETTMVVTKIAQINISKELIDNIDFNRIGNDIAAMLELAQEVQNDCEEISQAELISKLWNSLSGKTTNTLLRSQSFQMELSKMIMKLSALNTLFAKELNNQTEKLAKQQKIIDSQNEKIIEHQDELNKQAKEFQENQEKIIELILAQNSQDDELNKLDNKIEENSKSYKSQIKNIKYEIKNEYDNKYLILEEKHNKLKNKLVFVGVCILLLNILVFILVVVK